MLETKFTHNDIDSCHDNSLTLHDCVAEKMEFCDGVLRFVLSDGFWITPNHCDNNLNKIVRTDKAVVDFYIKDINDITLLVFTQNVFKKTKVENWEISEFIDAVNNGRYSIEFVFQYRTYFEQMWCCYIHSERKPYHRECQLHLPETKAIYRWNNLRPECEW